MRCLFALLAVLLLLATGCGRHHEDVYRVSRRLPSGRDKAWGPPHYELPAKPPALGEVHYARDPITAHLDYGYHPGPPAHQTAYSVDRGVVRNR